MKTYLFQLNHPSHYHLFKNIIAMLRDKGNIVIITNRSKDVLEKLLTNEKHINISVHYKKTISGKIKNLIDRERKLNFIIKKIRPNLLLGTSPEIAHLGKINKIPSLFFGEDDVNLSSIMYLGACLCYPFFSNIVSPIGCNNSIWNKKTIYYDGYQKLAYLHPNCFIPDRAKVDIPVYEKLFILRFVNSAAYHDVNTTGINNSIANKIINILLPHGRILITSERELPLEFEKYRFRGNLSDIHHYLYYANLFIGDSQSMAVEAAMLGTIGIRFNDFVGKISVLEEIENKYQLSIGIKSSQPDLLFEKIKEIIDDSNIQNTWKKRRQKMLSEKIDVTAFIVWFVENYPKSVKIIKENPDYQLKFK